MPLQGISDRAATLVKLVVQGLNLITPPQLALCLGELQRVLGLLADRATQVCAGLVPGGGQHIGRCSGTLCQCFLHG